MGRRCPPTSRYRLPLRVCTTPFSTAPFFGHDGLSPAKGFASALGSSRHSIPEHPPRLDERRAHKTSVGRWFSRRPVSFMMMMMMYQGMDQGMDGGWVKGRRRRREVDRCSLAGDFVSVGRVEDLAP